jgi:hypothetical protein
MRIVFLQPHCPPTIFLFHTAGIISMVLLLFYFDKREIARSLVLFPVRNEAFGFFGFSFRVRTCGQAK